MYNPQLIKEDEAENVMKEIGTTDVGIKIMVSKTKFRLVKLSTVRNSMANIIKQEMLSLGGDAAVNKGTVNCTVEKTDVLLIGTLGHYKELIKKLLIQPKECKDIGKELNQFLFK